MAINRSHLARFVVLPVLGLGLILGCLWRWTSWHERLGVQTLVHGARVLQSHPVWAPLIVMGVFVIAGLLMVAHAAALWATALTFDPLHAILYCELGSLASGIVVYGLARVLREGVVRRIAGSYMERVSRALGRRGVLTLVVLHTFPICPFSILNLIAGATHIRFRDFVLGTILGATPGILFLCFFGHHVVNTFHHPSALNIGLLAAFIAVGALVLRGFRKHALQPE